MLSSQKALHSVLLLSVILASAGCWSFPRVQEHLSLLHAYKAERHQELSDELAARAEEERAMRERCECDEEAREEQARRENIDSLRSKLSFQMDQRFVMNDLEVDTDELKELMAKRDKEYEEIKKLWDALERQMRQARTQQELQATRARMEELTCKAVEKGCCVEPPKCHRCRLFCCRCDIPEQPAQRMPELPAKRPVTPVDIPMVIKVRWRMGLESPQVEEARVRSLPAVPEMPAGYWCGKHPSQCRPEASCGPPGNASASNYPSTGDSTYPVNMKEPPPPIPDIEQLPPPKGKAAPLPSTEPGSIQQTQFYPNYTSALPQEFGLDHTMPRLIRFE